MKNPFKKSKIEKVEEPKIKTFYISDNIPPTPKKEVLLKCPKLGDYETSLQDCLFAKCPYLKDGKCTHLPNHREGEVFNMDFGKIGEEI